jgi:hypothetical protein
MSETKHESQKKTTSLRFEKYGLQELIELQDVTSHRRGNRKSHHFSAM